MMIHRRLRMTTRRSMAVVAIVALLCTGLHGEPRPGLYWGCWGLEAGGCRGHRTLLRLGPDARPCVWDFRLGVWRSAPEGDLVAGINARSDKVFLRAGRDFLLW